MRRTKVAVVEDHTLQRTYTTRLLASQPDLDVVFAGEALPDLLHWLRGAPPQHRPQLLLLDLMADRRDPADPVDVRRLVSGGVRVLIFSAMTSARLVRSMLESGVSGVIGKRDSEASILNAVRSTLSGREWMSTELAEVIAHDPQRPRLSDQEERALVLYSSGIPLDDVANSLGVKKDTAKKYLQRVRNKYAGAGRPMRSRLEMSRIAEADGYVEPTA